MAKCKRVATRFPLGGASAAALALTLAAVAYACDRDSGQNSRWAPSACARRATAKYDMRPASFRSAGPRRTRGAAAAASADLRATEMGESEASGAPTCPVCFDEMWIMGSPVRQRRELATGDFFFACGTHAICTQCDDRLRAADDRRCPSAGSRGGACRRTKQNRRPTATRRRPRSALAVAAWRWREAFR